MATVYKRTNPFLGTVGTTRTITVGTAVAVNIVLNSGNGGISIFNQGSSNLIWGDSSIAANSGNYIFPYSRFEQLGVQTGWGCYVLAESAQTFVNITEYRI